MWNEIQLRMEQRKDFWALRPRGRLSLDNADDLLQEINRLIEGESPKIALDLRDASYIGSSVIGALMVAHQEIARRQGRLVMGNLPPAIANTFRMARLDTVFHIVDDVEEHIDRAPPADPASGI